VFVVKGEVMKTTLERCYSDNDMKYDLFISHSSRIDPSHRSIVDNLTYSLKNDDLKVFIDRDSPASMPLPDTLETTLSQTRACLVVLGRQTLKSPWVAMEIAYCMRQKYARPFQMIAVRTVVDAYMPEEIKFDHLIDIFSPYDWNSIVRSIRRLL
jgi:hypothetical protein